jgi:tetratricopeptide (TPR) repeat protein
MFLLNYHPLNVAGSLVIAVTCSLTVMTTAAFAEPSKGGTKDGASSTQAKSAASAPDNKVVKGDADKGGGNAATAGGAVPFVKPDTANSAKQPQKPATTGDAAVASETDGANVGADETGTEGSITAREAQITPLEGAEPEEDPYAGHSKQQIALLQQHEAVQHFDASKYYTSKWDLELAELELRAAIMYMPNLKIAHRDYCVVAAMRFKPMRSFAELLMVLGLCEPIPLTEQQQKDLRIEAAQAHYKKGVEEAKKEKWDDAITEFMWSRTYLPNDIAIHRSLAFAYASKGNFKMAEQYYQSTFSIDPSDAFAHADFAYLLNSKGQKDQALAEMSKAVSVDPDSTALHVDLGFLAESKGDLTKAENEFRAALKRSPQYSSLWYHLGQLLEKKHNIKGAKVAYVTALEKESSNVDAQTALALLGGADAAVKPAPDGTKPVTDSSQPATEPAKPGASSAKPATDPAKPATDSAKPAVTPLAGASSLPNAGAKPADQKSENKPGSTAKPNSNTPAQTKL